MYYRVKKFSSGFKTMFVLDQDSNLAALRLRNSIDCVGTGPKIFVSPKLIESQNVYCINIGKDRNSDIIQE